MKRSRRWSSRLALIFVVSALAVAAAAQPAGATDDQLLPVQLVRVNVPTQADKDRLTNLGLDLTEHGGPTYVEAVLHTLDEATRLAANGFTWTVTIPDLGLREIANNKVNAAYAQATTASPLPSGRDTYRTLADYNADLNALAAANPTLVKRFTLSRKSLEGRDLVGVEISENVASTTDGKPAFLMLGLHHAREWPSGEHSMEFAIDLVKSYVAGDARVTGLPAGRASSSSRWSTWTASSSRASGATSSTPARSTTAGRSRSWAILATRTSERTAASPTARAPRRAPVRSRARAATASAST